MSAPARNTGAYTRLLRHLAARRKCLSVQEIAREMPETDARKIAKAAGALVSRGLLARRGAGCYVITPKGAEAAASGAKIAPGPKGPLTGVTRARAGFQARLWRALRIEKKGCLPDFIALADPRGLRDARGAAGRYLRELELAGYLKALPRRAAGNAPTSPGYKVWLLVRDTGPLAPRRRKGAVFDPNTREIFEHQREAAP